MTKKELDDKLNEATMQIGDLQVHLSNLRDEAKDIQVILENIDLDELEDEPKGE